MKIRNITQMQIVTAAIVAVLVCAACSDEWNDHYDASVQKTGTLWEAISSQGNLKNFTRVVQECGYDKLLNGSQTFSVFAPTDEHFTAGQADSLIAAFKADKKTGDDNSVIRQFLQNHISLYRHPVSSLTNDSIIMMNGKYAILTQNSIGNSQFLTKNTLYNNGVLFTLGSKVNYFPNVFEYLGLDHDLDSVYNFLNSYSVYVFDADKSVPGGIVDGRTVYLDSVSHLRNDLLSNTLGEINSEDSTYWMVAPVNDEWNKLVSEYHNYFNYDSKVNKRDSMQHANARLSVLKGTIFSRTINPDPAFQDSAVSTNASSYIVRHLLGDEPPYYIYEKPFSAGGIFDGTQDIICSNGHVRKATNLNINNHNTFLQTIKVEAENLVTLDSVSNANQPVVYTVQTNNPFYDRISGNAFVEVSPTTPSLNPVLRFKIPDVLSNVGYDIYAVFAPMLAYDTLATGSKRLPHQLRLELSYNDENGKEAKSSGTNTFTTHADVVDTMLLVSDFKFPTCSYGLTEPQVTLQLRSVVSSRYTTVYSRTVWVDCFIFKPHEEEATEQRNIKITN